MLRLVTLVLLATSVLASPLLSSESPEHDAKIIGGTGADIRNFPHQLFFQEYETSFCGASIISHYWALTAAHCCNVPSKGMSLRAGSSNKGSGGTVHQVVEKIPHPEFNLITYDYDLCLLMVYTPFVYREGVAPIGLPLPGQPTESGKVSIASGWGLTSVKPDYNPDVLQSIVLDVFSNAECMQTKVGRSFKVTDRMICAGRLTKGYSVCRGDSGSALVVDGELVGVVSWVPTKCGTADFPSVFARVSAMRNWIWSVTGV